jgi:hypothetical protein
MLHNSHDRAHHYTHDLLPAIGCSDCQIHSVIIFAHGEHNLEAEKEARPLFAI